MIQLLPLSFRPGRPRGAVVPRLRDEDWEESLSTELVEKIRS
jgi:hypothetical protein